MKYCIHCGVRPVRQALVDERGEQITIGYWSCQECSRDPHAGGCNDPEPHEMPNGCTRVSTRTKTLSFETFKEAAIEMRKLAEESGEPIMLRPTYRIVPPGEKP